jgi:hypothetical protein
LITTFGISQKFKILWKKQDLRVFFELALSKTPKTPQDQSPPDKKNNNKDKGSKAEAANALTDKIKDAIKGDVLKVVRCETQSC